MLIPSIPVLAIGLMLVMALAAVAWFVSSPIHSSKAGEHEGTGYKKVA